MAKSRTATTLTGAEASKLEENALEELVLIVGALEKTMKVAGRTSGRAQQRAVAAGRQLREASREALAVESNAADDFAAAIHVPDLFEATPPPTSTTLKH